MHRRPELLQNRSVSFQAHDFTTFIQTVSQMLHAKFQGTCNMGKDIRKVCPCNVYPTESHFYKAKLGYAGVYPFFLF